MASPETGCRGLILRNSASRMLPPGYSLWNLSGKEAASEDGWSRTGAEGRCGFRVGEGVVLLA